MIFLLISIFCSISVGILFKKLKPSLTESFIMIAINYLIAIFLSYILFDVQLSNINIDLKLVLPLVVLMPTVFYFFNLSINRSGIVKTDIAQRLSLIIPIFSAFFIFNENISFFKGIGIFLGFISILLLFYKKDFSIQKNSFALFLVFIGYGVIDVFFKKISFQKDVPFTSYLFFIFFGCLIYSLVMFFFIKFNLKKIRKVSYLLGFILGLLNFLNIYFYLKAHNFFSDQPSTVFAIMNFGVITLATIIGVFIFKEKLSLLNIFGLILAFLAIGFILSSQFNLI